MTNTKIIREVTISAKNRHFCKEKKGFTFCNLRLIVPRPVKRAG